MNIFQAIIFAIISVLMAVAAIHSQLSEPETPLTSTAALIVGSTLYGGLVIVDYVVV